MALLFSHLLCARLGAEEGVIIRYVPIGDSYTIGTGGPLQQSWPAVLTEHLRAEGIDIRLIANPARPGWTTGNAIELELPVFERLKPDFATLMIGTNDCARDADPKQFRANFARLLDAMLAVLPEPKRLLVVNIPDFSLSPAWKMYDASNLAARRVAAFNAVIAGESRKRGITVVDIYAVSRKMKDDLSWFARDGLHPSAKGYALFEAAVYPHAKRLLGNKRSYVY
jgi:lysophospholipase L1-like esterase